MRNSQSKFRRTLIRGTSESEVLVDDIVRYLSGLARLNAEEKIGNMELSIGLQHLVRALRPYADTPISGLSSAIAQETRSSRVKAASRKPRATLPTDLESLGQGEVERILADDAYTKQQVAELGARRFGMSQSSLTKLRKEDMLHSIRAALGHERSLDVISEEARKGGRARSI